MDQVTILLWISLIAAVPVAAAGLLLRRNAPGQGLPVRRGIVGWALILFGILLAAMVGYFFWRMNTAGGYCTSPAYQMGAPHVNCAEGWE